MCGRGLAQAVPPATPLFARSSWPPTYHQGVRPRSGPDPRCAPPAAGPTTPVPLSPGPSRTTVVRPLPSIPRKRLLHALDAHLFAAHGALARPVIGLPQRQGRERLVTVQVRREGSRLAHQQMRGGHPPTRPSCLPVDRSHRATNCPPPFVWAKASADFGSSTNYPPTRTLRNHGSNIFRVAMCRVRDRARYRR